MAKGKQKVVKLTLEQRYMIVKYIYRIPCTITVRLTIDGLVNQLMLSDDEKAAGYSVTYENGVPVPNDTDYVRTYLVDMLGPTVDGVRDYVRYLDDVIYEQTKDLPEDEANKLPDVVKHSKEIRDALGSLLNATEEEVEVPDELLGQ